MTFHLFRRCWPACASGERHRVVTFSPGQQLADETEAFLNGSLTELRAAQLRPIAPWMIVNRLAHGDIADLRGLLDGKTSPISMVAVPRGYNQAWIMGERALALRLLEAGHDAAQIRRVQHDVLVPLELQLISESTTDLFTLGRVVADARDALDQHWLGQ